MKEEGLFGFLWPRDSCANDLLKTDKGEGKVENLNMNAISGEIISTLVF